jgi:predicted nucleotidyltransferase
MVKTQADVMKLAKAYVAEANKFFYIKKAYLFGSYAKGSPHDWSDIDIALVSPDFKYIDQAMALKFLFRLTPYVDVAIEPLVLEEEEMNNPQLGSVAVDVAREGKLIFQSL